MYNSVLLLAPLAAVPRVDVTGKVRRHISKLFVLGADFLSIGFSPDPVLSGIAVGETVKGIQDAGVIACTKHYILNEQEHYRQGGKQTLLDSWCCSRLNADHVLKVVMLRTRSALMLTISHC